MYQCVHKAEKKHFILKAYWKFETKWYYINSYVYCPELDYRSKYVSVTEYATQNTPLWHKDYSEQRAIEKKHLQLPTNII